MAKTFWSKINLLFVFVPLLTITIFLYFYKLDKVPVHLNQDELMFSLNAYSIAKTGHDYYGNYLPFYFWHLDNFWATPVVVYWTSFFLKFLPISEVSIRVPTVTAGLLSALFLGILAIKIFKIKDYGLLGIFLMLLTPAFFINSRLAMDVIYTVPFVILWLLFLKAFEEKRELIFIFLSGLSLGIGIHSYHAAKIIMPLYFAVTLVYFLTGRKFNWKSFASFILGFIIPLVIFIPWLQKHPDTLTNQIGYVSSIDKRFKSYDVGRVLGSYISYFDPKILFVSGDRTLVHSTGQVGVFTFPIIFFLLFGILEIIFRKKDNFPKLILFGFLTYPLAPSLIDDPGRISRALVVIPFGVLISLYGISFLKNSREKSLSYLVLPLLLFIFLAFVVFLGDYFGDYRQRSQQVFNNNIGGGIESVLKSTKIRTISQIYLDKYIPYVGYYFNFYQLKFGTDIKGWQAYDYRTQDFTKFEKGSIVLLSTTSFPSNKPDKAGGFEKIEVVKEPDGNETFLVYYRER